MTESVSVAVISTAPSTQRHITYRSGLVLTLVPIPQGSLRIPRHD